MYLTRPIKKNIKINPTVIIQEYNVGKYINNKKL